MNKVSKVLHFSMDEESPKHRDYITTLLFGIGLVENWMDDKPGNFRLKLFLDTFMSTREDWSDLRHERKQEADFWSTIAEWKYNTSNMLQIEYASQRYFAFLMDKVFIEHQLEALDTLTTEGPEGSRRVKFLALLKLLTAMAGARSLLRCATNSDFWLCMEAGIDDIHFASFHLFHHLYTRGKAEVEVDYFYGWKHHLLRHYPGCRHTDDASGTTCPACNLGSEANIQATRAYLGDVIEKLDAIVNSTVFDDLFLEFFTMVLPGFPPSDDAEDEESNQDKLWKFIDLAENQMSYSGSDYLILTKLESLGFFEVECA